MRLTKKIKLLAIVPTIGAVSVVAFACSPKSTYKDNLGGLSELTKKTFMGSFNKKIKDATLTDLFTVTGNSKSAHVDFKLIKNEENGKKEKLMKLFFDAFENVKLDIHIIRGNKTINPGLRKDITIKDRNYETLKEVEFSIGDKLVFEFGKINDQYNQLGKEGYLYSKTFTVQNTKNFHLIDAKTEVENTLKEYNLINKDKPKSLLDEKIIFGKEYWLTYMASIVENIKIISRNLKAHKARAAEAEGSFKKGFKYNIKPIFKVLYGIYQDGHGDEWEALLSSFLGKADSKEKLFHIFDIFGLGQSVKNVIGQLIDDINKKDAKKVKFDENNNRVHKDLSFKALIKTSQAIIKDIDWEGLFKNAIELPALELNAISYAMYFIPALFQIKVNAKSILTGLLIALDYGNEIINPDNDEKATKENFKKLTDHVVNSLSNFRLWIKDNQIKDFIENMNLVGQIISPSILIPMVEKLIPESIKKTINNGEAKINKLINGFGTLHQLLIGFVNQYNEESTQWMNLNIKPKDTTLTSALLYLLDTFIITYPFSDKAKYTTVELKNAKNFSEAYLRRSIGGIIKLVNEQLLGNPIFGPLIKEQIKKAGITDIKKEFFKLIPSIDG